MASYSNTVLDQYTRPVPGVHVLVLTRAGAVAALRNASAAPIANPVATDTFGGFTFYADDGVYALEYRFGGVTQRLDDVIVGDPPAYVGPPGPADNTYATLAALLASDPSRKSARLVGDPAAADGVFSHDGTVWVRQAATGITFRDRDVDAKLRDTLHAFDFGARFDGVTNDTPALQAAVDAAHEQRKDLVLPGGTAILNTPLDLRGRYVRIRGGGFYRTFLKAGAAMDALIEARGETDDQLGAFHLSDLCLDGADLAAIGLAIRYRHNSTLDSLFVTNCGTGVWERDAWLSRRYNVRSNSNGVCWRLLGANHSSIWDGCSFIGGRTTSLLIEAEGSAGDDNDALLFNGCDIEFGTAGGAAEIGADIAEGVEVTFNGCYLGEAIEGDIIRNRGHTKVRGGIAFFGYTQTAVLARPLAGTLHFDGTKLAGQEFGNLSKLVDLQPDEIMGAGKVIFTNVQGNLTIGGNATIPGDPFGTVRTPTVAPRYGKSYTTHLNDATAETTRGTGWDASSVTVTCTGVTGPNPVIGVAAPLYNTDWRDGQLLKVLIVYASSKPITLHMSAGPLGANPLQPIGAPPERPGRSTWARLDVPAPASAVTHLEIFMAGAVAGDFLTVHRVTVCDPDVLDAAAKPLGNLFHA